MFNSYYYILMEKNNKEEIASKKEDNKNVENTNNSKEENNNNNKNNNIILPENENTKLPISKKQLKRIKKQEEWLKKKYEIKKYQKEKRKEKKRKEREQKKQEEKLNPKKQEEKLNENFQNIPFKSRKEFKEEFKQKCKNGLRVVIDCDFEHLMNEKENKSMVKQITYIYSVNRSSSNPFRLILYGVGNQIKEGLKKSNYENWLGIEVYFKEEYPTFDKFIEEVLYKGDKNSLNDMKKKVYYLTADSENNIEILDNRATYIIGGIVDRNRYKGLSFNKAKNLGINHGKFPIGQYLKLKSSQVLTTNHTYQILNEFSIKHDWKEAFLSVIPKRKQENGEEEEEEEENEDKKEKDKIKENKK